MTTYYLSTSGNNSNDGLSSGAAWATFAFAADNSTGGDTIRVLGGTYTQEIRGAASGGKLGGSAGNHKTWTADDLDDMPIIRPNAGTWRAINFTETTDRYSTWIGFIFDAVNCDQLAAGDVCKVDGTVGSASAADIVFDRCTFQNGGNNAAIVSTGDEATFLTCTFKDSGIGQGGLAHGIYYNAAAGIIRGCTATGNGGFGIHFYNNGTAGVIEKNICFDNDLDVSQSSNLIYQGSGGLIANNICYSTTSGNDNVGIYIAGSNNEIYNNTVYGHDNQGSPYGIFIAAGGSNNIVKNNVAYSNTTNYQDNGTSTTSSNNSTDGTDPKFVDAAGGDFHLLASSPLIDAGADLSGDGVTDDRDGNARPQGAAYDIGAYERIGAAAQANIGPVSIIRKIMKVKKL